MDERTLRVLEYDKVRELLSHQAASSLGKELVWQLKPRRDPRWVRARLEETSEARRLLATQGRPPLSGLTDVRPLIDRARIQGLLGPDELLRLADFLGCARRLRQYLVGGAQEAPRLAQLGERLRPNGDLENEVARCIDEEGNVRRQASEALARLTDRADVLERRIRERVEGILRREAERGTLQEPVIVQRAGRFCLAVQASAQARFQGIIHDRSASGATVFMEPLEVVEVGNELRETYLEIEAEVERILRTLTGAVAAVASELDENVRIMARVDFVMAKAALAQQMNATEPELVEEPRLRLKGARHPLLKGEVVPVDVWLGDEFNTLVITGPNTGGKTVTLKTVGLLALMTQSGLHIPAEPGSSMTVWQQVYADIGDEQSIEQSLSTFSSHMTQIVKIISRVRADQRRRQAAGEDGPARVLVLLDEIGAGTDPGEGAALARAVLGELHQAGCRTIATTHYNDLKVYAYETDGVENASVQFDVKTLRPTYRLLIGHAGSSNAFEIAQRLGLPRSVVRRARSHQSGGQRKFEQAVSQVEEQRRRLHDQTREAANAERELEQLKKQYAESLERLEQQRREALEKGFGEAEAVIQRAEQQAREIIAALQRQPRQSKETETLRQRLRNLRHEIEHQRAEALPAPERREQPEGRGLAFVLVGDRVHVPALGQDGTVVGVPRDNVAEVEVGSLRVQVTVSELQPPRNTPPTETTDLAQRLHIRKAFSVPRELDVRGMTVDEALLDLERYLDDAALAQFDQVRVIHGKGTGALRRGIHDFLRRHPQVRDFHLAEREDGGEGATVVVL